MEKIDITMTATIRPKIVRATLDSFCNKIFTERERYRLIINIDRIGEPYKVKNIIRICQKFFPDDQLIYRTTKYPSFPKAVIWTWQQVEAPWVFHLEDDWLCNYKVDIDDMIQIMKKFDLVSLRLNKTKTRKTKCAIKNGFTSAPKISLNPTLFNGEFIRNMVPLMTPKSNPEKQLRIGKGRHPRGKFLVGKRHGIYTRVSLKQMVQDTGRKWITSSRYKKPKGFNQTWQKKVKS